MLTLFRISSYGVFISDLEKNSRQCKCRLTISPSGFLNTSQVDIKSLFFYLGAVYTYSKENGKVFFSPPAHPTKTIKNQNLSERIAPMTSSFSIRCPQQGLGAGQRTDGKWRLQKVFTLESVFLRCAFSVTVFVGRLKREKSFQRKLIMEDTLIGIGIYMSAN